MTLDERLALLKSTPFALLEEPERRRLAQKLKTRTVHRGDAVFRKGDPGDAFYIVASGRAQVVEADSAPHAIQLGTLGRGGHFGEGALVSNTARGATVLATRDLQLLTLAKTDFDEALAEHPDVRNVLKRYMEDLGIHNFLKQFSVLGAVPATVLRDIVARLKPLSVKPGAVIVREGEPGHEFYIVRRGILEVSRSGGAEEQIVSYLGPGDFFGELSLLTGKNRAATVTAQSAAKLYVLPHEAFHASLEASPKLRSRLGRAVASYGRETSAPADSARRKR